VTGLALLLFAGMTMNVAGAAEANGPEAEARQLAFDAARGNCLACHAIADGAPAGDVGPPLAGLARRFPSRDALLAFLWDPRASRPQAMMPPYGRNGILSARELALLADWLWTL
jgi:sulfur-oxidizing protein SoxX